MSLLDTILGNASERDTEQLQEEFATILIPDEEIERAFGVFRDLSVFTDRRIVFVDRQGITGKKVSYLSIPYSTILRFSKENAGTFDSDAELKIWVKARSQPIVRRFSRNAEGGVDAVYQAISRHVL